MVYDGGTKRVLMTGGSTPVNGGNAFTFFNDLWSFDGTVWTPLPASGAQMSGIALAFDTRRSQIVSFGGYARGSSGDVRLLSQNVWRTEGSHPSAVAAEPGFVYDTRRDRFVFFGGSAGRGQAHGETWEYANAQWQRRDVEGPPARQGHVMVFDEKRGRVVVFGGSGSGSASQPPAMFGDTWEFDGNTWQRRSVEGPSPRASAGATFDTKRGQVILFGGAGPNGFAADTWAWDGTQWKKLSEAGPEPRAMGYLAYDQSRDRVVMFGGRKGWPDGDLNDTWEWDGAAWARKN
jgi:hypothetical protein